MICGKHIYQSRQAATGSVKGLNNDHRRGRSKVQSCQSYFCSDCGGWHISSAEQKRSKIKPSRNNTENLNTSQQENKRNDKKAHNKQFIVHSRLNFKVK